MDTKLMEKAGEAFKQSMKKTGNAEIKLLLKAAELYKRAGSDVDAVTCESLARICIDKLNEGK